MPTTHKNPPALRRDTTPARTMREQYGLENGHYRCDRCHRVMPEAVLIEQDGLDLCPLDAGKTSKSELDLLVAEQTSEVDSYEPCESPASNAFAAAAVVQSVDVTWPVRIVNDGAAVGITFTGINFTSDIAISYGDAGITDDSGPTITSTQIDLSLVASGVTPGLYDLTIDETTYRRVLEIV